MLEKTVREPLGAYMWSQGIFKPCLFDWDAPLGRSRRSSGALRRRPGGPGRAPGGRRGAFRGRGEGVDRRVLFGVFVFRKTCSRSSETTIFQVPRGRKTKGNCSKTVEVA